MTDRGRKRLGFKKSKLKALGRGYWSEFFAANILRLKGYRILARNFRCKSGEIDIIAKRGDLITFVEVKYRATLDTAVASVSYENQRRVSAAADYWRSRQSDITDYSLRFDIFAISGPFKFMHLEDAF